MLLVLILISVADLTVSQRTFNLNNKTNVVAYWGQGDGGDPNLGKVCDDPSYDLIMISFITTLGNYRQPKLDSDYFTVDDLNHCKSKGKTLMLSCGGGGNPLAFSSADDATNGAQQVWDTFLGGKSSSRPYGAFKFDGVDLDVESGNANFWAQFTNKLHDLFKEDSSQMYFLSSAPQCPFSDEQMGPDGTVWNGKPISGSAITKGWMDFVNVQFYNNPGCEVTQSGFNLEKWSTALRSKQQNNEMKIVLGLPASTSAADNGYVDPDRLPIQEFKKYVNFIGIMFWDVTAAQKNNNFQKRIKAVLLSK